MNIHHFYKLTETIMPDLGSKTRNFLSLHVVANKLPSRFKDKLYITSGCLSIIFTASPLPTSQTITR